VPHSLSYKKSMLQMILWNPRLEGTSVNTLVGTRSTWAEDVITLDQSCPIILSGRHQRSGLGHAFMSFNTLVGIANFYRLTLNATFPERLSHSPDLHEVRQFFGGDVFRARFGHVSCVKHFDVNPKTLADAVGKARKLCTTGPICIKVADELPPAEILVDVAGYRRYFDVPESASASLRTLPYFSDDYFRIAIHIRRGDVVNRTRYAGRWVSNQAYLDFIPKLLTRIKTRLPIAVMMFVEGAKSIEEIPDVVPSTFHIFSGVHKYIKLGPQEMHLTLAAFCDSDILVTSPSGYSHLASLLCVKPRILALPFWHSYATLPNTLTELSIERNETGAIVKLGIPASFHYDCDA